jgi:epoxyqueuosine reductase
LPSGTATFFTEKGTIKAIAQIYCGECDRCIKACPTGALEAPYTLNANKCTSYLTIEAAHWKNTETGVQKGAINRFDLLSMPNKIQAVNGWLFGCDECMNACPWNSRNRPSWREFLKAKRD